MYGQDASCPYISFHRGPLTAVKKIDEVPIRHFRANPKLTPALCFQGDEFFTAVDHENSTIPKRNSNREY